MSRARMALRAEQKGLTLVELLVAMTMTVIITGAAVSLLVSSLHKQQNVTRRADRIGQARNAIEKLTVDVRQGRKVTVAGPAAMTIETYCDNSSGASEQCTIAYSCVTEATGTYKCTRAKTLNGTTTTTTELTELTSPNVFCFVPSSVSGNESECGTLKSGSSATYVGMEVKYAVKEGGGATLQDGAALHNYGL